MALKIGNKNQIKVSDKFVLDEKGKEESKFVNYKKINFRVNKN